MVGARTALALALVLLVASAAMATDPPPPSQNIAQLPGLSKTQKSMGAAIDVVCPALAAVNTTAALGGAQKDLLDRCREMRQSAFVLSGGSTTPNNLALSLDPYSTILLALTPDQATSHGSTAVELGSNQSRAVGARLGAIRAGSTGIRITGLTFPTENGALALDRTIGWEALDAGLAEDSMLGRFGVFINGNGSFGDRDTTSRELGFSFHDAGVTAGVDYRFLDNLVAGIAFTFLSGSTSFDQNLGDVDAKSYGFTLYGTWSMGAFYVDSSIGFSWINYDSARRIAYTAGPGATGTAAGLVVDRTAKADTDGQQFTFNVGAGYDFRVGPVTLTPTLRVELIKLNVDSYNEHGSDGFDLHVKSQDLLSVQSALGGRAAYPISTSIGVLTPQVMVEWRHEYADNKRNITAKYIHDVTNTFFSIPTDDPDRDYVALGAGLAAQFARGVGAFVNFETALGLRNVTNYQFTGGIRVEF